MIDDIVEMILKEARARKGPNLSVRIYNVTGEVDRAVGEIMRKFFHEERRKEEDENKG